MHINLFFYINKKTSEIVFIYDIIDKSFFVPFDYEIIHTTTLFCISSFKNSRAAKE